MQRVQWSLGLDGGDANMCVKQRVQVCCPYGGNSASVVYSPLDMVSPPLDLMSPPLELTLSPLECAPLDTAQPLRSCAPFEVVASEVGKIYPVLRFF